MATLFSDGFWGRNYDDINEAGTRSHLWTYHTSYASGGPRLYLVSPDPNTNASRRVHCGAPGSARATVTPPSADYAVTVDYCLFSNLPSLRFGPTIRHLGGSDNYYGTYYQDGELVLFKRIDGVDTVLDAWSGQLNYGSGSTPFVYTLRIEANGTALGVYLNGTLRASATDGTIVDAGRPGLQGRAVTAQAYTGIHIDNYTVSDDAAITLEKRIAVAVTGL